MEQNTVNPAGNPTVTDAADPVVGSAASAEFDRRGSLAGELARVPKEEVDERRRGIRRSTRPR